MIENISMFDFPTNTRIILEPAVLMIRWPPLAVPKAIAPAQLAITQVGAWNEGDSPRMTKDITMIPIDFCASFAPWLSESAMEERICIRLKKYLALGVVL